MLPPDAQSAERDRSILVFCDVELTGLDPLRHELDTATCDILDRLTQRQIPIVLCSGKTRAELEVIRQRLGVNHPFICESGAAVLVPRGYFGVTIPHARDVAGYEAVEFGRSYADVVETLHRSASRLAIDVRGFSDMSIEDVASECRLPLLQARLAKLREYSEPFKIVDPDGSATPRLLKALRTAGLRCANRGGPFHCAQSVQRDVAADYLGRLYRRAYGAVVTRTFGDVECEIVLERGLPDRRVDPRW